MTTKERVQAELDTLGEEEMNQILRVIQRLNQKEAPPTPPQKPSLLSKLKQIKIEAPEDFAANLDAYASGEKQIGSPSDLH